jgi:hypothetical protein
MGALCISRHPDGTLPEKLWPFEAIASIAAVCEPQRWYTGATRKLRIEFRLARLFDIDDQPLELLHDCDGELLEEIAVHLRGIAGLPKNS